MKRCVALLFLCLYLFTAMNLVQLLKLPALVDHYIEHRDNKKNIKNFIEFLVLHYANDKAMATSDHHDRDMELPFKSHGCCNHFSSFYIISPLTFKINTKRQVMEMAFQPEVYTSFCSQYASTIWQPPKA